MASNEIKTKVKIEGEQQYKNSIKNINSELNKFNAESKRLASQLKLEGNAFKASADQRNNLKNTIDSLNNKVKEQEKIIEKTKNAIKENGDETGTLTRKLNAYQTELDKTKTKVNEYTIELAKVPNVTMIVGQSIQDMGNKMKASGDKIAGFGRSLSMATAPLAAALAKSVKFGAEFDAQMSSVAAVMNTTDEGMAKLRDTAISWGEKTVYTAKEAGDALYYMGLAGWNADEAMNSLGGVLNLAAAGNLDLGRTSDIVTDAMTALHLAADDYTNGIVNAEHFSNVLAATMSNSNTTVDLMGETFKYVAPVAGALGYNIEDLSVAIGLMANAGIKGTTAGTTLRNILNRMAKPTKESQEAMDALNVSLDDGQGNMLGFLDVIKQLRTGLQGVDGLTQFKEDIEALDKQLADGVISEAEYESAINDLVGTTLKAEDAEKARYASMLAGQRGMSGLLAIATASDDEFNELVNTIYSADSAFDGMGYAAGMAEKQMDNLKGDFTRFTSALGTAQIKISQVADKSLRKLVQGLTDLVVKFNNLDPKLQAQIVKWTAIAVATGPVLIAYGKLKAGIGTLVAGIGGAITKVGAFAGALNVTGNVGAAAAISGLNPYTLAIKAAVAAIGLAIAASEAHKAKVREEAQELYGLSDATKEQIDAINNSVSSFTSFTESMASANAGVKAQYESINGLVSTYNSLIDSNGKVKAGQEGYADLLLGRLADALGVEVDFIKQQIDANGQLGASIDELIQKKQQQAILDANYDSYVEALRNKSQAEQDYANALVATEEANQKLQQAEDAYNQVASDTSLGPAARGRQLRDLQVALDEATASQETANQALIDSQSVLEGYASVITNYEAAEQAVANGSDNMSDKILALSNNLLTAENTDRNTLLSQYNNLKSTYDNMVAAAESGSQQITQESIAEMQRLVIMSKQELDKAPPQMQQAGEQSADAYARGLINKEGVATNNARNISNATKNNMKADTSYEGSMTTAGYLGALDSAVGQAASKAARIAQATRASLAQSLSINSPSRVMKKLGAYVGEGYVLGIESQLRDIRLASLEMADATLGNVAGSNTQAVSKSISAPINVAVNVNGGVDDADELAKVVAERIEEQIIRRNEVFA